MVYGLSAFFVDNSVFGVWIIRIWCNIFSVLYTFLLHLLDKLYTVLTKILIMKENQPAENFYKQPNSWTQGRMYYTPAEFDLVSIAISKIELNKKDYEIHLKEISEISAKEWNEDQLFHNCQSIMTKPFFEEKPEKKGWKIYHVFVNFEFDRETNIVKTKINEDVLRDLFEVKNNMTYQELRSVVALNKQHSKRIYGWASQFKSSGICKIPLDKLKIMLGLKTEKTEKYLNFKEFKRSVLKASCDEITAKTNLTVSVSEEKNYDKTIKNIVFSIVEKKNIRDKSLAQLTSNKQDPTIYQLITATLMKYDIAEKILDKIGKYSTYEQMQTILDEIESKSYTNHPVKDVPAYIVNYYSKRLNLPIVEKTPLDSQFENL